MTQTMLATDRAAPLLAAVARLRGLLDQEAQAADQQWAGALWYGLSRLQERLRRQLDPDVDSTSTLQRRLEKLRRDYHDLQEQCQALKWEMYWAAQPVHDEPLGRVPPLRTTAAGTVPDYAALGQEVSRLLEQIEAKHAESNALTQESMNTDIGVGD